MEVQAGSVATDKCLSKEQSSFPENMPFFARHVSGKVGGDTV